MSERNQIKDRLCLKCNGTVRGKAHAVKKHAKQCDGTKPQPSLIILTEQAARSALVNDSRS